MKDCWSEMHSRKLQSAASTGNTSVLVWLCLETGPTAVVAMAGQRCIVRCRAAWPCGQCYYFLICTPDGEQRVLNVVRSLGKSDFILCFRWSARRCAERSSEPRLVVTAVARPLWGLDGGLPMLLVMCWWLLHAKY